MDKLIKKFFVCFDEDLKKIIYDIKIIIEMNKKYISGAENLLKIIEDEKLTDYEYMQKYCRSQKEKDILSNNEMIERCKKIITENENKLSLYHNMMKILSIL